MVEDPPWEKNRRSRGIDYIGLSLITLGLGCLQIMLDRGEDADWFQSNFICLMALLAFLGILGAIGWLLIARKPIVDLSVFEDRNFAGGCVMIAATGAILYASAVLIPQFAQTVLQYTATWAGLILSPGGIAVIILIPIVGRLMTQGPDALHHRDRLHHHGLRADLFEHAVAEHRLQDAGLHADLPDRGAGVSFRADQHDRLYDLPRGTQRRRRGAVCDVPECLRLDRNFARDREVTERSQVHQSYLAQWTSPLNQPYQALVAQYEQTLRAMGRVGAAGA